MIDAFSINPNSAAGTQDLAASQSLRRIHGLTRQHRQIPMRWPHGDSIISSSFPHGFAR